MSIADIFSDAQKSSINHKSLAKRLCKIGAKHESDRSNFEEQVKECVLRCLEVAKPERAGLNTVKFVSTYCAATQVQSEQDGQSEEEESDNITNQILVMLLPLMTSKDKVVRYRATQIVSQLMGIVQEIEDVLYRVIRSELGRRVRDKVPAIRLEAVCALGRLLENEMDQEAQAAREKSQNDDEDEDMSDEDGETESSDLLDKLLDVLQNDTNAEVRKALLLNLPIDPKTLPYLLERARDKDPAVRRALFAKLMPKVGDFRHLSVALREKLLRWGLRDRDEKVRKATCKMFSTLWIEQIAKSMHQADPERDGEAPRKKQIGYFEPNTAALAELLERLDTMNIGQEEGIGTEAMREFWEIRQDYFDMTSFDDDFFSSLSTETAFIARTFYEYCAQNPDKQLAATEDQKLPEVTRFGYHLQHYLEIVLEMHASIAASEEVDEELLAEQEFICEQLLHIAHSLDYTDEIGRRKMFTLLRQMIGIAGLPDEITRLSIEALRLTCTPGVAGEKDFIAVVQEAISDVLDTLSNETTDNNDNGTNRETSPADDESFVSAHSEVFRGSDETTRPPQSGQHKNLSPEETEQLHIRTVLTQLKCLDIAHTLLQNITCDFSTNISLDTLLNTLIVPAVRSNDAPLRERAIECLGLACLLSQTLWRDNRDLFKQCMRKGHEELQVRSLRIICDCTIMHHDNAPNLQLLDDETTSQVRVDLAPFVKAFKYSAAVQTCATTCIAKLMMAGFYKPKVKTVVSDTDPNTDMGVELDEAEEEEESDVFVVAIETAVQGGTKGSDLLVKVKAALMADAIALQAPPV